MQTRKYARTMNEAFPFGPAYGCAIEKPSKKEKIAEYLLAILIGVIYAALLFVELSK